MHTHTHTHTHTCTHTHAHAHMHTRTHTHTHATHTKYAQTKSTRTHTPCMHTCIHMSMRMCLSWSDQAPALSHAITLADWYSYADWLHSSSYYVCLHLQSTQIHRNKSGREPYVYSCTISPLHVKKQLTLIATLLTASSPEQIVQRLVLVHDSCISACCCCIQLNLFDAYTILWPYLRMHFACYIRTWTHIASNSPLCMISRGSRYKWYRAWVSHIPVRYGSIPIISRCQSVNKETGM